MSHVQINIKFYITWVTELYVKNKTLSSSFKIHRHPLKMFISPFKYSVHLNTSP